MKNKLIEMLSKLIKFQLLIGVWAFTLFFTSCDVFQKEPLNNITPTEVWNDSIIAGAYLNNLYHIVMPGFSGTANAKNSDESIGGSSDINYTLYGMLTRDSVAAFSSTTYANIRKINLLLQNIESGNLPKNIVQKIKGQAFFLRAWVYWSLVRLYGGVPMIMTISQSVVNGDLPEFLFVKRNTTRQCVELIAADLDSAYQYLPPRWDSDNYGRITRGAAIAMKGRVLLFWASPQFNPSNKQERWNWAYDVNKEALTVLTQDGYGLHSSFKDLFTNCVKRTIEAILVRPYDNSTNNSAYYHAYDKAVRPSYLGGGSSNQPTWDMVKAFPMTDGYPVDADSTEYPFNSNGRFNKYNQNLFWVNRDPRLTVTIAYNSCAWPLSGVTTYKMWTYFYNGYDNGIQVLKNTEGPSYTRTGFYCRKYINPAITVDNTDNVGTDWMEIRFAEVLLNFAECANEIPGNFSEVKNALYRIRNERTDVKVGMGYIDANIDNQAVLREIIMNERKVEFAFENKRYWDLRRRNMFQEDLGPNVKKLNETRRCGWKVLLNESPSRTPEYVQSIRDGLDLSQANVYNTYFKAGVRDTLDTQYPINYPQPQYNFFAIPQINLDKNPNLEQTIFWGGSFDPYAE